MDDTEQTELLARQLADGVAALRQGDFSRAAALLVRVCDDPAFSAAKDLLDIQSRAASLCAEALWLSGDLASAARRAATALQLARKAGDIEGINEVERLQQRIDRSSPRQSAHTEPPLPDRPRPKGLTSEAERSLDLASAALDAARPEEARAHAEGALSLADGQPRIEVLGRLLLAKADPPRARERLVEAARLAREASQPNLLRLVARTAELLDITLGDDLDGGTPSEDEP